MKDAKEHVDRLLVNLNAQQDQLNVRENDLQDRWSILEAKETESTARDEALKSRASQADHRDSELDARAREISSFSDEVQRDRKDLSQRRAAVEAFEVEVDGRGERVRLLEEQVAEQRAAVEMCIERNNVTINSSKDSSQERDGHVYNSVHMPGCFGGALWGFL